jgi:hypothetical protein
MPASFYIHLELYNYVHVRRKAPLEAEGHDGGLRIEIRRQSRVGTTRREREAHVEEEWVEDMSCYDERQRNDGSVGWDSSQHSAQDEEERKRELTPSR